MKKTAQVLSFALAASASAMTFADTSTSPHQITGNIAVLSSYILRGNTAVPENADATVQGGLDYSHSSGFYAGYWGSTLDYSFTGFDPVTEQFTGSKAFENDFYLGYNGQITEDLGYTIGGAYYYYHESDVESDVFETLVGLSYKDFTLTAQTLTDDVVWGNAGDTYIAANYNYALPRDFNLSTTLGLYYYSDSGDFEGTSLDTKEDFNFRHLTFGLSHPLGNTGASMNVDYIVGGNDRSDKSLKNKVVLGLSYSF